ncbi:N-acetylmuramoyl-L-alanine amidase [Paenibacillus sp. FSL W8-0187]|uniref:N-acetylmuramoyl-L-alanine amidase family protein n=1 Tax=Paenibacillus sp. FSL W8-0187 TaxID=2921710 RepID=UPI0030D7A528
MKKGATIIPLILSAIFIILLYNNLSNEGSASYRMADITSSNDRSHGKQTQHDPESTYIVVIDPADLFISIHGNTYEDSSVSGIETYYYNDNSFILADLMHKHSVKGVGFRDRGVKHEDFFVLKDTNMPAVLLEMCYLTNPQEEEEMLTEEVQYRIASSILDGIKEYLTLQ